MLRFPQVEDPSGHTLFEKRGLSSGQFAFTTKEDGDFKACFTAKGARHLGGTSRENRIEAKRSARPRGPGCRA